MPIEPSWVSALLIVFVCFSKAKEWQTSTTYSGILWDANGNFKGFECQVHSGGRVMRVRCSCRLEKVWRR